jgi:hypothetical protein
LKDELVTEVMVSALDVRSIEHDTFLILIKSCVSRKLLTAMLETT